MTVLSDLDAFLTAFSRISQTRQNAQNNINLPEFDTQDLVSEQVANQIIANASSVTLTLL